MAITTITTKSGHMAKDFHRPKTKKGEKIVRTLLRGPFDVDASSVVVPEVNRVDKPRAWFINTSETKHICSDKSRNACKQVERKKIYMSNKDL